SASSSGVFSLAIGPRHGRETNRAGRANARIRHRSAVERHLRLGPATEPAAVGRELRPVRALAARHPAVAVRTELARHWWSPTMRASCGRPWTSCACGPTMFLRYRLTLTGQSQVGMRG